ncbi:MAG: RluA family pseudouridine synthase [Deltaproteobacteria bacterium]|nr:RluA family pseudouridine synthase [Deltaproteobacteria bacterium]
MSLPTVKWISSQVLWQDSHCLVVNKPARLLTLGDDSGDDTLLALVREFHASRQAPGKKGYVAPLHSLDRPVSGAVMFALSSKAASRLSAQMRGRDIGKTYLAIVEGTPPGPSGVLTGALLKDRDRNVTTMVQAGTAGSKSCELAFRVIARHGGLTLVAVAPKTGRSHQIRVQLADAGMPIYGDVKYGASVPWEGQIALHARALAFHHPITKELIEVVAALPPVWQSIWPAPIAENIHV